MVGYFGDGLLFIEDDIYNNDYSHVTSNLITMSDFGSTIISNNISYYDTTIANGNYNYINGKVQIYQYGIWNIVPPTPPWFTKTGIIRTNDLMRTVTITEFNSNYEYYISVENLDNNVFLITSSGIYKSV